MVEISIQPTVTISVDGTEYELDEGDVLVLEDEWKWEGRLEESTSDGWFVFDPVYHTRTGEWEQGDRESFNEHILEVEIRNGFVRVQSDFSVE